MSIGTEPDRDQRHDEEQALEEIRLLFARYRRFARHGIVTERADVAEPPEKLSETTARPAGP
jgi:hypothetical protein